MQKLLKILVVDDEPPVAEVLARNLMLLGCAVTQAYTANGALNFFRDGKKYDVLIADLVMPGMTGRELVDHVAELPSELRPERMFIYSGNATEEQVGSNAKLLRKPMLREEWKKILFPE